jgi:hypothetical protein
MESIEAMQVPASLSWEQAASIPLTFLVTYDMLVLQGRLQAGEWLLVNGVSSGVGVSSLQMGKALGAKVIGTSGSNDKLAALEAAGPGRRAVHPPARLRAGGDGSHGPEGRRPGGQHRRRHRVRRGPALHGLRGPARHGGLRRRRSCMPTSTSRRCMPSG